MPRDEAREAFYGRIRRALTHLESEVIAGRIGAYGISSNTFVVPRENEDAVSLERVLENAGPGFAVVQLPFNPLETGAREPIHTADGRRAWTSLWSGCGAPLTCATSSARSAESSGLDR